MYVSAFRLDMKNREPQFTYQIFMYVLYYNIPGLMIFTSILLSFSETKFREKETLDKHFAFLFLEH